MTTPDLPISPPATRVPLSILDLAVVSEGSTGAQALRDTLDTAVRADELGYRRIWFAEHHLSPGVASASPAVLAALVAERTSRIRVGSGAVLLSTTSPLVAAEQFGTIAALHPGRVDLGLGRAFTPPPAQGEPSGGADAPSSGGTEATATEPAPVAASARPTGTRVVDGLLVPSAPGVDFSDTALRQRLLAQKEVVGASRTPAELRAELELVLGLRAGAFKDSEGTAWTSPPVEGAAFDLFVLASSGGVSARVAGELGLPLAANYHVGPSATLDTIATYRAAFRPGVLDRPYVVVSADVLVADSDAEARRIGDPFTAWVLSIRRGAGGAIAYPAPGTSPTWEELSDADRAAVQDRVDTRFVGSPQTVVERLETLARVTEADEIVVTTAAHDPADRARSFELLAQHWGLPGLSGATAREPALGRNHPPEPENHMSEHHPVLTPAIDAGARVAGGAFLVDVRSEGGRAAAGAIPGATVTDRDDLDAIFGPAAAPAVSLDTPVVVVCGSERGSGPVAEALAARGYTNVSHVEGGFPAWRDAGLPASSPVDAAPSGPHEPVRQRA